MLFPTLTSKLYTDQAGPILMLMASPAVTISPSCSLKQWLKNCLPQPIYSVKCLPGFETSHAHQGNFSKVETLTCLFFDPNSTTSCYEMGNCSFEHPPNIRKYQLPTMTRRQPSFAEHTLTLVIRAGNFCSIMLVGDYSVLGCPPSAMSLSTPATLVW